MAHTYIVCCPTVNKLSVFCLIEYYFVNGEYSFDKSYLCFCKILHTHVGRYNYFILHKYDILLGAYRRLFLIECMLYVFQFLIITHLYHYTIFCNIILILLSVADHCNALGQPVKSL